MAEIEAPETTPPTLGSLTNSIVEGIHGTQRVILEAMRGAVDGLSTIHPELWERPLAEGSPSASQLSAQAFDLGDQIIDSQREVSRKVTHTVLAELHKLV